MPRPIDLREQLNITDNLINKVVNIRQRRRWIEEQWLRARRAWFATGNDRHFRSTDSSKNDYDIPMARRTAEKTIARGVKLLTPSSKWFEVLGVDADDERTANVDKYLNYVMRKRIKTRAIVSQLMRSMFIYGRCHLRTGIIVKNGLTWPTQRVVDPFSFYTFPENVTSDDDVTLTFEDFLFSYEKYETFVDRGFLNEVPRSELTAPDWPYHVVERLAQQGITTPGEDYSIYKDKVKENLTASSVDFLSLSEVWIPRKDELYQGYILWNHDKGPRLLNFYASDYDEPMYKTAVHRGLVGEAYTNSIMDDITELQDLANDTLNQFLDASDFEQGMVLLDDSKVSRMDSIKAKGRAVWHLNDAPKDAVVFTQPNISSTNQLRSWQIVTGMINSLGGAGTMAEGQPGRNMPRAGNAVSQLIDLSMADIKDMAEMIEQEVLTPGLGDIYKITEQFMPDHQLSKIPGGQGLYGAILRKDQIIGDYEFEWVGSQQFQDESVRAQRGMIFLNMAPQLQQSLMQQGFQLNMPELVKFIWRYSMGERGLADIIQPMEQQGPQDGEGDELDLASLLGGGGGNTNSNSGSNGSDANSPVPGLKYNLQNPSNGFVQQ